MTDGVGRARSAGTGGVRRPGERVRAAVRRRSRGGGALAAAALVLAGLTLTPLLALGLSALQSSGEALGHVLGTLLPGYLLTTLLLALAVAFIVTVVGVGTAWLVTMCRFPGRKLFVFALVLPLAMPGYVSAYAYTYLLSHPGPVQSALRAFADLGPRDYWFPDIRSLEGAAFVLGFVLYPYVMLMARAAFLEQSSSAFETSRLFGRSSLGAFLGVAVPLARPAIVAGLALALMETLADYGTVAHFGVDTFTTAIYRTWFSMGERVAAVQLALALVGLVLLVLALERTVRRARRFSEGAVGRPFKGLPLTGWRAAGAIAACAAPVALGFLVPAGTLVWLGVTNAVPWLDGRTLSLVASTVSVAALGAAVAVCVALVIAMARRIAPGRATAIAGQLAGFGYAVPGAVIAVGLLIPLGGFDRWLNAQMVAAFGVSTGLLLTGTVAALVFAYVVRFLAVSLNALDAGLARISASLDGASRTLGAGWGRTVRKVHAPLLSGGLLTAFLITFVDIMKELPATLILRPFDFETLAIRAHRLASDERLAMAAVPSLMIVVAGLVPVIIVCRQIGRTGRHASTPPPGLPLIVDDAAQAPMPAEEGASAGRV